MIKAVVLFIFLAVMLLQLFSVTIYPKSALDFALSKSGRFPTAENPLITAGMIAVNGPLQEDIPLGSLFSNADSLADTLTLGGYSSVGSLSYPDGAQAALLASNTWISVSPATGPYTGRVTLSATLRKLILPTATVSGKTISFKLKGSLVGSAITDRNGVATLSDVRLPDDLNLGIHLDAIKADFAGDANYTKSSASGILTVTYAPTQLTVDNINAPYGSTVTLGATLISSFTGEGLSDKVLTVLINNEIKGTTITDANGVATLEVNLGKMSVGTYPILVTFLQVVGNYAPITASAKLKIEDRPTSLALENSTGIYGGSVTLKAVLSSLGVPLENKTVSFTVNGNPAGSVKTTAGGIAALPFSLDGINAGYYPGAIKAEFAEDNYAASSALCDLTVQQAPSAITVSNTAGTYDWKVSLSARLTAASSGTPLGGRTILFRINGADIGSAVTGSDGAATLPEASVAGIPAGTYDDYIEAVFSPAGGNYAPSSGKGSLEISLAPTCISINKITAVYCSKVDLEATLTAYEAPLSGKPVEFRLNGQLVGAAITGADGKAVINSIDLTGISAGIHPGSFCATFIGADPYKGCTSTADIEISKAPTNVSVTSAVVQYSDKFILTAVVTSVSQESLNNSGGSIEFKYELQNEYHMNRGQQYALGTSSQAVVSDGKLVFNFESVCSLDPDNYKILAEFTPSDRANFNTSCNTSPYAHLLVEPEDALIEYTGPQYFSAPSCSNALLTLSAAIRDTDDCSRGDISKARVEFREAELGSIYNNWIVQAPNLPVVLTDPTDNTLGISATQPFQRNLTQSEINTSGVTFGVYTKVRGYYAKLSTPSLVTIAISGNDNVSGGGFIVPASTAGKYRGKPGAKTDFGFTMKYNKSCESVPGLASVIIRGENEKIFQVNSSNISMVSVYTADKKPGKAACFNALVDLIDITDPFNQVKLGRNLCLTIEMYDGGKDKNMAAISITLRGEKSELLYSNNWDGYKTLPQVMDMSMSDGKIEVAGSSLLSNVDALKIVPAEYALFQNYPNPFNPSTTIQYDLPEDSRVKITVYDILGKEISLIVDAEIPAGRHQTIWNSHQHGSFSSGIYILRINAVSLSSKRNLISTKKMLLVK